MYSLRVSVLDQCQLRCGFCLPDGPKNILPKSDWLTIEQYQKISLALKSFNIQKVRFTGGEPLLRPQLASIIEVFAKNIPQSVLSLTTNGLKFLPIKEDLKRAGLKNLNFHLDTLDKNNYRRLMGQGSVDQVLTAIDEALALGFFTKINVVVQKGRNDHELRDFLKLSKKLNVEVRFIELMNTGSAKQYVQNTFLSGQDILTAIGGQEIISLGRKKPSDPAEIFWAKELDVKFGLIASDTKPFCQNCDRLRLSPNGELRTCLYQPVGQKIPHWLSIDEMTKSIKDIILMKSSYHPALKKDRRDFSMSQMGG